MAYQEEAFKAIVDVYGGMSHDDAREYIQRHYHLLLADAPWDLKDETLVPEAGSCVKCPQRTGSQPELFADVKAKDTCTNPACFNTKKKAWVELRVQRAEAEGNALRSAAEAQKALKTGDFVDLDQRGWIDGEHTTLREKLGKKAQKVQTTVAAAKDGLAVIELASKVEVDKLLGRDRDEKKRADENAEFERGQAKAAAENALRNALADTMLGLIAEKVQGRETFGKPFWYVLAGAACDRFNPDDKVLARHFGKPAEKDADYGAVTAKMTEGQLRSLVVECVIGEALWEFRRGEGGPIGEIARVLGIDEKKVKASVKAEIEGKPEPKAAKPKKGKKK